MADSLKSLSMLSHLRSEQHDRWQRGDRVLVEGFFERYGELLSDDEALLDFVYSEFCMREAMGDQVNPDEYVRRFPKLALQLTALLELHWALQPAGERQAKTPEQSAADSVADRAGLETTGMVSPNSTPNCRLPRAAQPMTGDGVFDLSQLGDDTPPESIGRFQIISELGSGGFGVVYKAYDPELKRDVAIKVAHKRLLANASAEVAYLEEAQKVACLDHPEIVPVYDAGKTPDGLCFVVSKYVPGGSLAEKMKTARFTPHEAADFIAKVAEALHHAHQRGLVHRDVKPGNILLDAQGNPMVADFGLALRDDDFGKGPGFSGTPTYMSPEQARHEGHLVDARSDIYSLGVMFYELLAGRRPYRSHKMAELLHEITTVEPRPARQINDKIPAELDRICLKALAKRVTDRYSTALDMATDLRRYLDNRAAPSSTTRRRPMLVAACLVAAAGLALVYLRPATDQRAPSDNRKGPVVGLDDGQVKPVAAQDVELIVHMQRAQETGTFRVLSAEDMPLHEGDKVQIVMHSTKPCYLYVHSYDVHGKATRLWPNNTDDQKPISEISMPADGRWYPLDNEHGNEMILATVSDHPVSADVLDRFQQENAYRDPSMPPLPSLLSLQFKDKVISPDSEGGLVRGFGAPVSSSKVPLSESFEDLLKTTFASGKAIIVPHK